MSPSPTPRRGEVWWFDPDPVRGRELGKKVRPALVVSVDHFNQGPSQKVIVVPATSKDHTVASRVRFDHQIKGRAETSFFCCDDVRAISVERLRGRMGSQLVPSRIMVLVERWLRDIMNL